MLSLRIKLRNVNLLYESKISPRIILWDSNLIVDRTQSSAVGESLLCDYSMEVDYILEINLTKRGFKVVRIALCVVFWFGQASTVTTSLQ